MNFIKRALLSLWHRKRSVLFLFVIFLLLSTLILSSFSMLSACRQSSETMKNDIGAYVTVNDYNVLDTDILYGSNLISEESVQKIAAHPLVKSYNPYYYSAIKENPQIKPVIVGAQVGKYITGNDMLRVEGTGDLLSTSEFVTGNYTLTEGSRAFEEEDLGAAIISVDVAEESRISLGDEITLSAFYDDYGGEDIEVEIIGLYAIKDYEPHTDAPFYNSENLVYVTPDVARTLNGENPKVYNAKFYISDPEKAVEFVKDIESMNLTEGKDLQFVIDDTQYQSMKGSISSMEAISLSMLVASIIMGAIVLVLLIMINLKDRDYELGVLLSIGESKARIILQMLIEYLVPVILAMTAAILISKLLESGIAWLFEGSLTASISATGGTIALMYISGIILTVISSIVMIHKVITYKPKKILTAIELN